jgi:F420-dependent oxidoreductase-like protein
MRLGAFLDQVGTRDGLADLVGLAQEADRLGLDSVWIAEAWGTDAPTVLSWIGATTERIRIGSAVMQIPARTPTSAASAAAMLDLLTDGRFVLGLGLSGPQVAEGWHGAAWGKPLGKTREYVEIVRSVFRREVVAHAGAHYTIPYQGEDATGLGVALKPIVHPLRPDLPIMLASLGPKSVELAAEIADGWMPFLFAPERFGEVFLPSLNAGLARAGGDKSLADFDVAPLVPTALGDDVAECRDRLKPMLALYIGGMGARGQNFYNDVVSRFGFEEDAARIQDLYLDRKQADAVAAVPDALVDAVALVGPADRVRDRLEAWREAGVGTLIASTKRAEDLRRLAEILL